MINIDNVSRSYQRGDSTVHAVRAVSCDIETASFNFILGPSGSGKSSLLYLIGALDEPTSGTISVAGRSLTGMSARERDAYRRDDVGFIFQSFNLLGNLDAVDNVLVPYLPRGVPDDLRRRAVELLGLVGLSGRLDHRPSQLSGGEQQRIAIARALLKRPKVILADEPTGELDSATGQEVFGLLRELASQHHTTVVVVTHDESHITTDDRVLRMRDGVLQSGSGGTSPAETRPIDSRAVE